jgi:hypothetical protein
VVVRQSLFFILIIVLQSFNNYGIGRSFASGISKADISRYHDYVGVDWGKIA